MSKKIVSLFVAFMLVAGIFGGVTASAQSIDLSTMTSAQLTQLLQQLTSLLGGSSVAPVAAPATTFTRDLSVGSTGTDVRDLQLFLNTQVGTSLPGTTYFGPLTKAAVIKFQTMNGVPGTGYVGPLTRGAIATKQAPVVVPPVVVTPPAGTPDNSGITTPGVEGTLTVSTNPNPGSGKTIREGDSQEAVLGLKLEAKLSDINVQRVKIDLGNSTVVYNKLFDKIYLMDGSTVVAESDLNSSTVVKEGSTYYITLAGFNVLVSKDSTKVLTLALDAKTSIDSAYDNVATYGLAIPAAGVRGVDGAGLNQTGPSAAISRRTVTIDSSAAVDDAALKISLNNSTPGLQQVVANSGSTEDEIDELSVLTFNLKAEKAEVLVTDLIVGITRGGVQTTATTATAYLYDGSDLVGSATVNGTAIGAMSATFSDIDLTVAKDSTKVLTVKVDVVDAGTGVTTFVAAVSSLTAENADGTDVVETGSATGKTISVVKGGGIISLGSKSINVITGTAASTGVSTSTVEAIFDVKIKAEGGDLILGTVASGTPTFGTSTAFFKVYKDGTAETLNVASSTSYSAPSGYTVTNNSFTLAEGDEVTIPVKFTFSARTVAGTGIGSTNSFAVGLEGVQVIDAAGASTYTFMAGDVAWRTGEKSVGGQGN